MDVSVETDTVAGTSVWTGSTVVFPGAPIQADSRVIASDKVKISRFIFSPRSNLIGKRRRKQQKVPLMLAYAAGDGAESIINEKSAWAIAQADSKGTSNF